MLKNYKKEIDQMGEIISIQSQQQKHEEKSMTFNHISNNSESKEQNL